MVRLRSGASTRESDPAAKSSAVEDQDGEGESRFMAGSSSTRSRPDRRKQDNEEAAKAAASDNADDASRGGVDVRNTEKKKARLDTSQKQPEGPNQVVHPNVVHMQESAEQNTVENTLLIDEKQRRRAGKSAGILPNARETVAHRCGFVDFKPEAIETLAGSGSVMAVGRHSGEIELWERRESALHQRLAVPGSRSQGLRALVWLGGRLFGANLDGSICEVDFGKRTQVPNESVGGGGIWAMDASNNMLATACEDGRVRLYTPKALDVGVDYDRTLSGGSSGRLLCIKFHAVDSTYLFTSGMDGIIRKWSVKQRRVIEQVVVPSFSRALTVWTLDTHGESLACGDSLGRVHIWSKFELGTPQTFSEHRADVLTVKFAGDGKSLFASGIDPRVIGFRIAHDAWVYVYSHRAHTHDVRALSMFNAERDEVLCSGGVDTQLAWYPTRSFERARPRKETPFRHQICVFPSTAFERNRERLLLVMHTFRLELWHVDTETKQHSHLAVITFDDDTTIRCAALSNEGRFVACADDTRGLSLFRVELHDFSMSGEDGADDEDAEISVHKINVSSFGRLLPCSLIFGGSDSMLIVGTSDQLLILDVNTLSMTRSFPLMNGPLFSLCASRDGQWLAGLAVRSQLDAPEAVDIFNLDSMRQHGTLPASVFDSSFHAAFSFSPDSSELILARSNGSVYGFKVEERAIANWQLRMPVQNPERIIGITFNPGEEDAVILWSWSCVTVLNRTHPDREARTLRKFKPIRHLEFLTTDNLLVLEAPFVTTIKHLPDVVERDRYGT